MNKLGIGLGIGIGLLAIAGITMAQSPPPGGPNGQFGGAQGGGPSGPGGPPGGGGPGHGPGPGFRPHMMMPPPPPSKGAQFRMADGNRRFFIKCADDDSTKACMEAVGPLLNKLTDSK